MEQVTQRRVNVASTGVQKPLKAKSSVFDVPPVAAGAVFDPLSVPIIYDVPMPTAPAHGGRDLYGPIIKRMKPGWRRVWRLAEEQGK